MKQRLVIDTDVGTDVDDLFSLTYAIRNKADVRTITTVHGNTEIRAKIARKLEKILNVDIPIIAGERCSEKMIEKYWCGFEHLALTEEEIREPIEQKPFPAYERETKLVCIGPLTNIAFQLEKNSTIKNVRDIYVMGESLESHNFMVDPEATEQVFSQVWNIYQISKPVSKKISFTREELENFRGTDLGNFLYESAIRWLNYSGKTRVIMYDVLVMSSALSEDFVKFEQKEKNKFVSCDVNPKLKSKIIKIIKG